MRVRRILEPLFAAILVTLITPGDGHAQFCPAGSTQVQSGYVIECHCPNGSLAGPQGCGASYQPPPQSICPAGTSYCANDNRCCNPGFYCSHYGCTPVGAVECGSYYCNSGQACMTGRKCMPSSDTDCKNGTACGRGYVCSRGRGCIPENTVDCGEGKYCQAGSKCSRDGKRCDAQDAVDCGSYSCQAGLKCGSGNHCLERDTVDCGGGRACAAGSVCVNGGAVCATPAELAERAAAEKQAAQEKVTFEKRLKELPAQQKKEDADALIWLKYTQTRIANEAAEKQKAAAAEAARQAQANSLKQAQQSTTVTTIRPGNAGSTKQQPVAQNQSAAHIITQDQKQSETQNNKSGQIAQTMTSSQFDQKYCPQAAIMTIAGDSSAKIATQRHLCVQQDLSGPSAIKGNCSIVDAMAACGCYTVSQVQAEAAALGCSGYSSAALTLLPSLSSPAATGPTSSNGPVSTIATSGALPTTPTSALSSSQMEFLKANSVGLNPQSAAPTANSPNNFNPQPVSQASFTVGPSGQANASVWDRLQTAGSFANSSAATNSNFKAGVQGGAITVGVAGVGCVVGAAAGAAVGLGVGGIPGCGAGAVAATASFRVSL